MRADQIRVGYVIQRAPYGPCRVLANDRSGHLRKLTWMPVNQPWRVPNPPGIDYVEPHGEYQIGPATESSK